MRNTALILLASVLLAGPAAAASFEVLHHFAGNHKKDGQDPLSPLIADGEGHFYGTASDGGRSGQDGALYGLTRNGDGSFSYAATLVSFPFGSGNGARNPFGSLIRDAGGALYGTAKNGAVYKLAPRDGGKWQSDLLTTITLGNITSGLTYQGQASGAPYDGVSPLYGVVQLGGAHGQGAVYELTHAGGSWSARAIHDFCAEGGTCSDGAQPRADLLMDAAGDLLGVTSEGGAGQTSIGVGAGVAFRLSPNGDGSWSESVLHAFCNKKNCTDGAVPNGPLIVDATGSLLGVTALGGRCKHVKLGCGTIYKLTPDGGGGYVHGVLQAFCKTFACADGRTPSGRLVLDASGTLYGVTQFGGGHDGDDQHLGGGTLYAFSNDTLSVLHTFCSKFVCMDGEYPTIEPVLDADGALLGTTTMGGNRHLGALYRVVP